MVNAVHLSKARAPIVLREAGKVMLVKAIHSLKAFAPISIRLDGRVTEVKFGCRLNAESPILVTVLGITTLVIKALPFIIENASCSISTTGRLLILSGIRTVVAVPRYTSMTIPLPSVVVEYKKSFGEFADEVAGAAAGVSVHVVPLFV